MSFQEGGAGRPTTESVSHPSWKKRTYLNYTYCARIWKR